MDAAKRAGDAGCRAETLEGRALAHAGVDHSPDAAHLIDPLPPAAAMDAVRTTAAAADEAGDVRNPDAAPAQRTVPRAASRAAPRRRGGRTPFLFTPVPEDARLAVHTHTRLTLVIDGQSLPVPANLGVTPEGALPIHTHEAGTVHVESPRPIRPRLEHVLAVARHTGGAPADLDLRADAGHELSVTVNGRPTRRRLNQRLREGDEIVISYRGRPGAAGVDGAPSETATHAADATRATAASRVGVVGDILCSQLPDQTSTTNAGCWAPVQQPASLLDSPGGREKLRLQPGQWVHIYPNYGGHLPASHPELYLSYACSDGSLTCHPSGRDNPPGMLTKPGFVARGAFPAEFQDIPPDDDRPPVPPVSPGAESRQVCATDAWFRHRSGNHHPTGVLYKGDRFSVERYDENGWAVGWAYGPGVDGLDHYGRVLRNALCGG